ncbi:MAG: ATP-dependent helicase, partial [Bacteroidota bacterium]
SISYSEALNRQQLAVVQAGDGATLVVAGAGTGKTRTLVYRVAYLVETGTPPEQIVLLTFTRRAAKEMIDRATSLLDGRCRRVRGGTFHAFCLELLRAYGDRAGLPKTFTVLDGSDSADVLNVLRTAHGFHKSERRFPKKGTLRTMFSSVRNREVSLAELLETEYPQFTALLPQLTELYGAYDAYKKKHALVDYDDLLLRTADLLERNQDLRRTVSGRCRHVLVDEYQDTNQVQARLVRLFASVHGNVMAVGDDAQSIYRFRGADFRNIFFFPEQFPGARLLKLERNYRSTQPILDLANRVLQQASRRYDKTLFTDRKGGDLPAVVPCPDEHYETRFVCQLILQLREEGVPLNRQAVLFRSSHNSFDLELELNRRKIPFVKFGGLKLSEAAHVKDVIAHLKVLENPLDAVAWNRILLLLEGIGPKTAQSMTEWIASQKDPFVTDRPFTSSRYEVGLANLFEVLANLRRTPQPLPAEVDTLLRYYLPMLDRLYPDDVDKRTQDLEHFAGLAQTATDRAGFLNALALDPVEMTAVDAIGEDKDEAPLTLSTIHSAKGLEFHSVFLIKAVEGVLPSTYALKKEEDLDEELRLLYVAVTRAEENLFVSYPTIQRGRGFGDHFTNPSRFIADLPDAILEPVQLVEAPAAELPAADTSRLLEDGSQA